MLRASSLLKNSRRAALLMEQRPSSSSSSSAPLDPQQPKCCWKSSSATSSPSPAPTQSWRQLPSVDTTPGVKPLRTQQQQQQPQRPAPGRFLLGHANGTTTPAAAPAPAVPAAAPPPPPPPRRANPLERMQRPQQQLHQHQQSPQIVVRPTHQQQQPQQQQVQQRMDEFFKRPPTPNPVPQQPQPDAIKPSNISMRRPSIMSNNSSNNQIRMQQQQQQQRQEPMQQQQQQRQQTMQQQQPQQPNWNNRRGQQQQQGTTTTTTTMTTTDDGPNAAAIQQRLQLLNHPLRRPQQPAAAQAAAAAPSQQQHQQLQQQQPDLVETIRKSFALPPPDPASGSSSSSNSTASSRWTTTPRRPSLPGRRMGAAAAAPLSQQEQQQQQQKKKMMDPTDISKLRSALFQQPRPNTNKDDTSSSSSRQPAPTPYSPTPSSWTLSNLRSARPQSPMRDAALDSSNPNNDNDSGGGGSGSTGISALRSTLKTVMGGYLDKQSSSSKTSMSLSSSPLFSANNLRSPLSEKILAMQLKHAQQKKEQGNQNNNNDNSASPLRDLRRRSAAARQNQNIFKPRMDTEALEHEILGTTPPPPSSSAWQRTTTHHDRRRRRSRRRSPAAAAASKPVRVLNHDYNLKEVSLLLREKTRDLKRVLWQIGEGARLKNNNVNAAGEGEDGGVNDRPRLLADEDIVLEPDVVELICLELSRPVERVAETRQSDEELLLQRRALAESENAMEAYDVFSPRPPVVCIMGHVDHGKTTLMDALRRRAQTAAGASGAETKKKRKKKDKKGKKKEAVNGNVAGTEAGGITQVISAFQVPLAVEDQDDADAVDAVTFLDTPGHAAFKSMRQSGSDAADIIVLVVAADDGVSEQTIEIINFYKSIVASSGDGGISMVVAMNKIDKPGINVDQAQMQIEGQLLEHGIMTEGMSAAGSLSDTDFGQPVQLIPVSGLTGEGLDDLIDGLVLQSEVMDLRADETDKAEGVVMDARVEKGLGIVVDCIIRWGSIQKGSAVVCGTKCGKVRILKDVNNKIIQEGLPSQPVRIVGFEELPKAGDPIVCVETEEEGEELVEKRKAAMWASESNATADNTAGQAELQSSGKHLMNYMWRERLEEKHGIEDQDENAPIRIPVIIRADADGTLAAIRDAIVEIGESSKHNVVIDPIHEGVGPTLATDIEMAKLSDATILCFNVKNEAVVKTLAEEEGVPLLRNNVIYALLDEARETLGRHLPTIPTEIMHGRGTVKTVFDIGGIEGKVAGMEVDEGTLYKDKAPPTETSGGKLKCFYRVIRDGKVISNSDEIKATSLKHFKEDVLEVSRGKDCGLSLGLHSNFAEGDVIECYSIEQKKQTV